MPENFWNGDGGEEAWTEYGGMVAQYELASR